MVMGIHTAYRCKACGEIFFRNKLSGQVSCCEDGENPKPRPSPLQSVVRALFGCCPRCGSSKVVKDPSVRT
jgi:uncharacterized protein (DUF983 family)